MLPEKKSPHHHQFELPSPKIECHRALLARLGNAVFRRCVAESVSQSTSTSASESAAGAELVGAARLLCALLDIEHRVLLPHLDQSWAVLWRAGAQGRVFDLNQNP